jgi:hypothetical protein
MAIIFLHRFHFLAFYIVEKVDLWIVLFPTELSEREDAPLVMWKSTYENDFADGGEIGK